MKESPFGFEYDWEDLRPIHPLCISILVAQILGGVVGLSVNHFPNWLDNLWMGGASASFPGFLIGIPIQLRMLPGSIRDNYVMVRRGGMLALVFSVAGLFMPYWHSG